MKIVVAVIRPRFLEEIAETLAECGIVGITATKVSGYGREQRIKGAGHSTLDNGDYENKVQTEIVIPDNRQDEVIQILDRIAKTGKVGDGKIFIKEMDNAVRIRDGGSGDVIL